MPLLEPVRRFFSEESEMYIVSPAANRIPFTPFSPPPSPLLLLLSVVAASDVCPLKMFSSDAVISSIESVSLAYTASDL